MSHVYGIPRRFIYTYMFMFISHIHSHTLHTCRYDKSAGVGSQNVSRIRILTYMQRHLCRTAQIRRQRRVKRLRWDPLPFQLDRQKEYAGIFQQSLISCLLFENFFFEKIQRRVKQLHWDPLPFQLVDILK